MQTDERVHRALQVIAEPDERYEAYCASSDFIREHIFPGGHLPSMGAMVQAARGTALQVRILCASRIAVAVTDIQHAVHLQHSLGDALLVAVHTSCYVGQPMTCSNRLGKRAPSCRCTTARTLGRTTQSRCVHGERLGRRARPKC